MKRQDRIARGLGEPHRTGLRDPRGTARTVDGEPRSVAGGHVARQLPQRFSRPPGRGPSGGTVAKSLDDPRDPLAVKVLARDHDDALATKVIRGRQNPAVPERHDRMAAVCRDPVEMLESLDAPPE